MSNTKAVMTYKLVSNEKSISAEIRKVAEHFAKGKELVQNAAINIIRHVQKTGDYRKANELVEAIGTTARGKALVRWFETFGFLEIGKDEEAKKKQFVGFTGGMKHQEAAAKIKASFGTAKATWWNETIPQEDAFESYSATEDLIRLADKISKKRKKAAETGNDKIDTNVSLAAMEHFLQVTGAQMPVIEPKPKAKPKAKPRKSKAAQPAAH